MSKVCDEDCFNCKFDDCIMDGLGRFPAPEKELSQDPRNIRRRNYWREHSEELNAKKRAHYAAHKEEINARRRKRTEEKRNGHKKV